MNERIFRLGMIGAGRMGRTHLRALAGAATVADGGSYVYSYRRVLSDLYLAEGLN